MKDTFIPSTNTIKSQWFIIDAKDKCLGRLATTVVKILRGKTKVFYSPSQDTGDYVIIINAKEIQVTGNKATQKIYMRHSGRPGGKTIETFQQLQARIPERIVEKAIKGMLPKNRLGRQLFTKLKVYQGEIHPHMAQKPQVINLQ
jgi:large subunit ribosomal protein L13